MHVARFGKHFAMPFGAESHTHTRVPARLVYRIGVSGSRDNNRERSGGEGSDRAAGRRRELLIPMIEAAAADSVEVKMAPGRKMHNGIHCGGKDMNASAGNPQAAQRGAIETHRIIIQLAHHADVTV